MTFDTDKNKVTINFIDPIGGKLVKDLAIERFDAEHPLFTTVGDSEITLAVSESPIFPSPEPSILVLLLSGAASLVVWGWRGRRSC